MSAVSGETTLNLPPRIRLVGNNNNFCPSPEFLFPLPCPCLFLFVHPALVLSLCLAASSRVLYVCVFSVSPIQYLMHEGGICHILVRMGHVLLLLLLLQLLPAVISIASAEAPGPGDGGRSRKSR